MTQQTYERKNYYKLVVELGPNDQVVIPTTGDYIEVLDIEGAKLSDILVAFNYGDLIPLSIANASVTPFRYLTVKNPTGNNVKITFLIGMELFRTSRYNIAIVQDYVGLARESTLSSILSRLDVALSTRASEDTLTSINAKLSQSTTLKSEDVILDNSGGTADLVQALFATSTPSRYATIYRDPSDTGLVYIGDSNKQVFPLEPGGKIETQVSDLSVIYVRVPPGVVANIHVLWEV